MGVGLAADLPANKPPKKLYFANSTATNKIFFFVKKENVRVKQYICKEGMEKEVQKGFNLFFFVMRREGNKRRRYQYQEGDKKRERRKERRWSTAGRRRQDSERMKKKEEKGKKKEKKKKSSRGTSGGVKKALKHVPTTFCDLQLSGATLRSHPLLYRVYPISYCYTKLATVF